MWTTRNGAPKNIFCFANFNSFYSFAVKRLSFNFLFDLFVSVLLVKLFLILCGWQSSVGIIQPSDSEPESHGENSSGRPSSRPSEASGNSGYVRKLKRWL